MSDSVVPTLLYAVKSNPDANTAKIYTLNLQPEPDRPVALESGTLAISTYAMAGHNEEGRIYYIGSHGQSTARVYYWDRQTGENRYIGMVGTYEGSAPFVKMAHAANGKLFALESGTTNLYTVDKQTGNVREYGCISGGSVPFTAGSGGAAFDPNHPNRLYITVVNRNRQEKFSIYRIDLDIEAETHPNDLQAVYIGHLNITVDSGSLGIVDGKFYVSSQEDVYEINVENLSWNRIGTVGFVPNDFTTLGDGSPKITSTTTQDLKITKAEFDRQSAQPGETVTLVVEAKNDSSQPVDGVTLRSTIPQFITNIQWHAQHIGEHIGAENFPGAADQSGEGNYITSRFNLGAGTTIAYTITGTIAPNPASSSISVTVTITAPESFTDATSSNNSATANLEISA